MFADLLGARRPLVAVEWVDSVRPARVEWQWLSDIEPSRAVECWSVGWLIQDDEHVKVLVPNIGGQDPEAQICGQICIPARAVKRIVTLKGVEYALTPSNITPSTEL